MLQKVEREKPPFVSNSAILLPTAFKEKLSGFSRYTETTQTMLLVHFQWKKEKND